MFVRDVSTTDEEKEDSGDEESSDGYSIDEEEHERDAKRELIKILADADSLKKGAIQYAHPENTIKAADPTLFGRNYYSRPSASETVTKEETDAKAVIFEDVISLKNNVKSYSHPEISVEGVESTVFGKNYFSGFVDEEER